MQAVDYYLIKWEGWSNDYNTWEPKNHLVDCMDAVEEYHRLVNVHSITRGVKRQLVKSSASSVESKKNRVQELLEHIWSYNDSITAVNLLDEWKASRHSGRPIVRPTRTSGIKSNAGDMSNKRTKAYRTRK